MTFRSENKEPLIFCKNLMYDPSQHEMDERWEKLYLVPGMNFKETKDSENDVQCGFVIMYPETEETVYAVEFNTYESKSQVDNFRRLLERLIELSNDDNLPNLEFIHLDESKVRFPVIDYDDDEDYEDDQEEKM